MNRRTFVERAVVVLPIVGVAGCVGSVPSNEGVETETPDSDETSESTDATTAERNTEATTPGTTEATATPTTTTDTGTATDVETTMGTATVADDSAETATVPTRTTTTPTPVRKTARDVSAAFTITDYVRPTRFEETANASFDPDRSRIVVEGRTRIYDCGRLTLRSVRNDGKTIVLVVGSDTYSATTETRTVVCETAMTEYEITITVDGNLPEKIRVVHRTETGETFTITP